MNTWQKIIAVCSMLVVATMAVVPAFATGGGHGPIPICHATSSESNPYTHQTVDVDSIIKPSGHNGHSDDIIPEFWYNKNNKSQVVFNSDDIPFLWWLFGLVRHYAGKNLDLGNPFDGCPSGYETCDEQVAQTPVTEWGEWSEWAFNSDTGLMERERTGTTTTTYVDARDGETFCGEDVEELYEKETRDPEQRFLSEETCEGWEVFQTGEGVDGNELVDAGVWENPLVDESFFHKEYDNLQIDEPQDCFEVGEDVSFEADCENWSVFALTLVDGEVVASELIDSGEWRNIYKQEKVVVVVEEQELTFYEPAECVQCKREAIGEMFTLIGPDGEIGYLASYQRNPNTGDWAIPNVGAQQTCLGFVAVAAPEGKTIYRDCNGEINIVCYRCMGGADSIPGAYKGR